MTQRRPVSLALVALFLWLTGCTAYTQIEIGEVADHGKIRVTTIDGQRETIHDPRVESDSIRSKDSEAIPLDQVSVVESARFAWLATALVTAAVVVPVALITAQVVECATNSYGSEC